MNYKRLIDHHIKNIPPDFNQCQLLRELDNPEIDHYFSITTRTDGKSFNYMHFFIRLALEYEELNFLLLGRHFTLRNELLTNIMDIYNEPSNSLNPDDLVVKRTDHYIILMNKDQMIGVISDLNASTDLKYASNFLKNFPIIIYDEFLAREQDYNPSEYFSIKDIYESVDRKWNLPVIGSPKCFYLGNAVNFNSPILAGFDIFNILEKHKIGTMRQYGKFAIEMFKNENNNAKRNMRAFDSEQDAMSTAQFNYNSFNVLTDEQRQDFTNTRYFCIKLDEYYLRVVYSIHTRKAYMKLVQTDQEYDYCINVVDLKEGVKILREKNFSPNHYRKYIRSYYLFDNSFTKDYILKSDYLTSLKINKLINQHEAKYKESAETIEKIYKDRYMENTLKALAKKFELG